MSETARQRVLFISPQPYFQWRGSPIRVSFNMLALAELGYEVDLLCLPFGEDRHADRVRIIRVANFGTLRDIPIGPSPWKLIFDFKLWRRARQLIREQRYDFIHAVEDAGIFAPSLARRSQARFIFEKHSDPGSYRKRGLRNLVMAAYARLETHAVKQADAVIGTGPALVAQAQAIAPDTPCHHIFDIASSLEEPVPERVAAIRDELQQQPDEVLITYVGSFAVYQGIDLLFDAIPLVIQQKSQARFVIIGGTAAEIAERRRRLGSAADAVTFLGKISPDELPNYLAASDVLLSSRIAGTNTPLKLLDYLKVGRCILATDNQANRLILDDDTARFVQPIPTDFADGLCALVDDPALRQRLAARGQSLIRDTYNFDEFKRRLGEVYAGLGRFK